MSTENVSSFGTDDSVIGTVNLDGKVIEISNGLLVVRDSAPEDDVAYRIQSRPSMCGMDLEGTDWTKYDLSGIDATEVNLRTATLYKANLRGTRLDDARMCYANLEDADLRGASLRYADLSAAKLRCADLRGADLTGATLCCADMDFADLRGAVIDGTNITGASLSYAIVDGVQIGNAYLEGVRTDMHSLLYSAPDGSAQALLEALESGNLDGNMWTGDKRSVLGTIARHAGVDNVPGMGLGDYNRIIECFSGLIRPGDTPYNSEAARLLYIWVKEWLALC